jgi:hypothetical protein
MAGIVILKMKYRKNIRARIKIEKIKTDNN